MILFYLNKYLIKTYNPFMVVLMYAYFGFVIFLLVNPEIEKKMFMNIYAHIENIKRKLVTFIQDKGLVEHPFLVNCFNKVNKLLLTNNITNNDILTNTSQIIKYEDKYLTKYNAFPLEYKWNDMEIELEKKYYNDMKNEFEQNLESDLNIVKTKLSELDNILNGSEENMAKYAGFDDYSQYELVNGSGDELTSDVDSFNIKSELRNIIQTERDKYAVVLNDLESKQITHDELTSISREKILNIKLDNFINNYVLEHTPVGNVYMRYNNDKKSFEYFSNHSIPYRYLESIGRKYVMTFYCKPLFVDLETEFEKSRQKKNEKEKEEQLNIEKKKLENLKKNSKNIFATLKSYNNTNSNSKGSQRPTKNRENTFVPIKPNLILLNENNDDSDKLLKEKSNRYTWEGRIHDVTIIKKIPRNEVDKNFSMKFSDFKKLKININP